MTDWFEIHPMSRSHYTLQFCYLETFLMVTRGQVNFQYQLLAYGENSNARIFWIKGPNGLSFGTGYLLGCVSLKHRVREVSDLFKTILDEYPYLTSKEPLRGHGAISGVESRCHLF